MDELDFLIEETMKVKSDVELSYKENSDVKRMIRIVDEERGFSLWWLPLIGCVSSYIFVYVFLKNIVTSYKVLNLFLSIVEFVYLQSIIAVLILTFIGIKKLNLKKGALI
ncbi:MAG: hypothetical protein ACRCX8_13580 [Sarcina sp.]